MWRCRGIYKGHLRVPIPSHPMKSSGAAARVVPKSGSGLGLQRRDLLALLEGKAPAAWLQVLPCRLRLGVGVVMMF